MAMLHMYCGLVGPVQLHAPEGHLTAVLPTLVEVVQNVIHEQTRRTISVQASSAKRKLRLQCFSEPLPSLTASLNHSLSLNCFFCLQWCTRLSRKTLMYAASKTNDLHVMGWRLIGNMYGCMGLWRWNEHSDEVGVKHVCHKRRMSPVSADNAFVTS